MTDRPMTDRPRIDRIAWLDVARGISIFLVVTYHVFLLAGLDGIATADLYSRLNAPIQTMRMPLFFTVSALLMGRGARLGWPDFLRYRIWPTVWLFLLWNSAYVLLRGQPPVLALTSIWDLQVQSSHLWFLWALIAFRLLGRALDGVRIPALAVAAAVSLVTYHIPAEQLSFVQKNLLKYAVFFLFALWYGQPVAAFMRQRPGACLLICLVAVAGFWALYIRSAVAVFGVAGLCAASMLIADHLSGLRRLLSWLGRHTLEIFLLHFALIPPLLWALAPLPGQSWWLIPVAGLIATLLPVGVRRLTGARTPWLYAAPPLPPSWRMATPAAPADRPAWPR